MSINFSSGDVKSHLLQISYNDIATKLIQDKFLLTALEFHTELVESGRELKLLKDFFSNPGNFELQTQEIPSRISRSGSQATLDSLDLTRFSEFGDGSDERVAVLEFELRKAKETINALRNNLTVATVNFIESETSNLNEGSIRNITKSAIKPHEQRALNFLINEYLLIHGYKLTSITFADENENQDFDDWDDVGLNIAKPPELYNLYREGLKQSGQNCVSTQCQTDYQSYQETIDKSNKLEDELLNIKSKLKDIENECSNLNCLNLNLQKENDLLSSSLNNEDLSELAKKLPSNKGSLGSDSPERFEIIDKKSESIIIMEDNVSNNSFNINEWTNLCITENKEGDFQKESKGVTKDSFGYLKNINKISWDHSYNFSKEPFLTEVFNLCYVKLPKKVDDDTLENILNETITTDTLVHTLSDSLLKIVPNIILNKREEVIPLLIKTIHLHPKASERDKLLQQLFNLKKKPGVLERQIILAGLVAIAKCSGQSLVENEILPQCWLQLTHKHCERRILVAEACTALIPFVSSPIRNSLILSMLQQMLEDKEEAVRETVLKALSLLFSICEDTDKYSQCEQLALGTLNDSSSIIVNLSTQLLFPVLGKWAFKEGYLSSSLLKQLLHKFNIYLKGTDSPSKISQASDKILRILNVLENLLPFLLMSIALKKHILSNIEKGIAIEIRSDFLKLCSHLTNPENFYKSEINSGMVIFEFDKYIANHPRENWNELNWILDIMLPDLINNLNHIDTSQQALLHSFMNLFSHICIIFGKNFTKYKIRPLLESQIENLEQIISSFNQFCPSLNIIPVYLVSVLSYCDDYEGLTNTLKKFTCALPLCGAPLDCLELTVRRLCEADLQELVVNSLWEAVVHQRPLVRSAAATLFSDIISMCDQPLLSQKVTPALVTLANDNDVLVKTASISALGNLITDCAVTEIHDKAYMQLQAFMTDATLKETHTLLRQLIVVLGNIVNSCTAKFKNEVIIPQLVGFSQFTMQMTNQTRKVDMVLALVEAFTNIVYNPLNKENIDSTVVPALKCLESIVIENQSLMSHRETILLMIKECDNKENKPEAFTSVQSPVELGTKLSQNVNQGVEEMRQRVSKIFNKPSISKPNNLSNLQGIFKKK
ncbi:unnamed protein product [Brassicogethes aeneus]|uniref:LisH domain-containing protein n=1 Tax=Brassicogethes aeneus TaxID=1431903 RepID=A0A9P0F9V7_BRAAE|nr:unnamed protein product [Brassicogethes aeneus]